jgi:anti-anti-sigma factor
MLIQLKGDLKIERVNQLAEKFKKVLKPQLQLKLDLSNITDIDTAGLQLILAVEKELKESGGSLFITTASSKVEKMMNFYNLSLTGSD